jgi:hypothetical protein
MSSLPHDFSANGLHCITQSFQEKSGSLSVFTGHPSSLLTVLSPGEVSVQIRGGGTHHALVTNPDTLPHYLGSNVQLTGPVPGIIKELGFPLTVKSNGALLGKRRLQRDLAEISASITTGREVVVHGTLEMATPGSYL